MEKYFDHLEHQDWKPVIVNKKKKTEEPKKRVKPDSNIKDIEKLPQMMESIIENNKYEEMIENLNKVKKYFTLDFTCEYIIDKLEYV